MIGRGLDHVTRWMRRGGVDVDERLASGSLMWPTFHVLEHDALARHAARIGEQLADAVTSMSRLAETHDPDPMGQNPYLAEAFAALAREQLRIAACLGDLIDALTGEAS